MDVVLHFTPRDHRFRPFVLPGPGASFDVLGKNAKKWGEALPPNAGFGGFNTDERFQGNYGGGIKYQANKWFGFRFDVRGLTGIGPRFGLPTGPPSLGVRLYTRRQNSERHSGHCRTHALSGPSRRASAASTSATAATAAAALRGRSIQAPSAPARPRFVRAMR